MALAAMIVEMMGTATPKTGGATAHASISSADKRIVYCAAQLGDTLETPANQIFLSVRNEDLDESKLNKVTHELMGTLNREGGVEASTETSEGAAGSKGVWTTIGGIVMKLVGGGEAVKSVMGVLQAYAARNKSFSFDMTKPDGTKITINAQNLSGSAFQQTMQQVTDFVKS